MVTALRADQVELLNQVLVDQATNGVSPCRYRGCSHPGRYYLRRSLKHGAVQAGLYCEDCDERFGEQNLRREARMAGGRVVTLRDEPRSGVDPDKYGECGEFRGVQVL